MYSLNPCTTYQLPRVDNKNALLMCVVNLSVDALFLCLAQIIRHIISKSWKLSLKRLAKGLIVQRKVDVVDNQYNA